MPNYVPKEKKPVLNREIIKKNLKDRFTYPLPCYFLLLILIAGLLFLAIRVALAISAEDIGMLKPIYMAGWIASMSLLTLVSLCAFIHGISVYTMIDQGKFDVHSDVLDHKVSREPIGFRFGLHRTRRSSLFATVLYFNNHGRFELFRSKGRGSSWSDEYVTSLLERYESGKTYLVVTIKRKKPRIVLAYDPDEYDVQL